jgi:hypothetical protein
MYVNQSKGGNVKKRIAFTSGVIAVGMSLTGCIAQQGFHWSNRAPDAGDTTKGVFDLQGVPQGEPTDAYFFVGVSGKGSGVNPKPGKFDPGDKIGEKQNMVADAALAEAYQTECDSPIGAFYMFRTQDPVKSSPNPRKLFGANLRLRTQQGGGGFAGFVQTGQWFDDGDGEPEDPGSSDDEYNCSGLSTTFVGTKGFEGEAMRSLAP